MPKKSNRYFRFSMLKTYYKFLKLRNPIIQTNFRTNQYFILIYIYRLWFLRVREGHIVSKFQLLFEIVGKRTHLIIIYINE